MGEGDYIPITQIWTPPFDLLGYEEDHVLGNTISPAEPTSVQGECSVYSDPTLTDATVAQMTN